MRTSFVAIAVALCYCALAILKQQQRLIKNASTLKKRTNLTLTIQ